MVLHVDFLDDLKEYIVAFRLLAVSQVGGFVEARLKSHIPFPFLPTHSKTIMACAVSQNWWPIDVDFLSVLNVATGIVQYHTAVVDCYFFYYM